VFGLTCNTRAVPQGNRTKENGPSFRQGMPDKSAGQPICKGSTARRVRGKDVPNASSAMDGNVPDAQVCDLGMRWVIACHPWTLDSGIHAGMTVLFGFLTICIASCDCLAPSLTPR
jgi:hypothetical protein